MIKVGINGFGRIGRLATRIILTKYQQELDLVCINTSGKINTAGWTHLFKYDTAYGKYKGEVKAENDQLVVQGKLIPVSGIREPKDIPWEKYGVQIVIESTGIFLKKEKVGQHLRGTVKKVIMAAPPKDETIPMYIIGVNSDKIGQEKIISCASCTTNCAAPIVKVIEENFGISKALMTTIHAYTSDQELLDGSHKDLRRSRAAAANIVPTTTGAAKSVGEVYPAVKDKFDGLAIRVPVITGSLTDFTFVTKKRTNQEEVNNIFSKAAQGNLKGILAVTNEPIVSADIIGLEASSLVDLSLTKVIDGDLVKVIAWYDNEWGYANRLVEETVLLAKRLNDS